ncbi:MAG TPA: hypothetical protein H9828_02555, partial [Candidatus Alistipes intestinigallinarum]|nr:hypothetical protein [Candidatus Alistipes intestinigallinarum]
GRGRERRNEERVKKSEAKRASHNSPKQPHSPEAVPRNKIPANMVCRDFLLSWLRKSRKIGRFSPPNFEHFKFISVSTATFAAGLRKLCTFFAAPNQAQHPVANRLKQKT